MCSGRAPTSRSTPPWCGRSSRRLPRRSAGRPAIPATPEEVAQGFLKIAVENMANAIKQISVQRGYDVTGYALACFGGAGGPHAGRGADLLGVTTVFVLPLGGGPAAFGLGPPGLGGVGGGAGGQRPGGPG